MPKLVQILEQALRGYVAVQSQKTSKFGTKSVTHSPAASVSLNVFCFHHILTLFVIYYLGDAWQYATIC